MLLFQKIIRQAPNRHDMEMRLDANKHHILFEKCYWSVISGGSLREQPDLIALMDTDTHRDLHHQVPPVPPLGNTITRKLIHEYNDILDSCGHDSNVSDKVHVSGVPVFGIAVLNLALDRVAELRSITDLELVQIDLMKENLRMQAEFIARSNEILDKRCYEMELALGINPVIELDAAVVGGDDADDCGATYINNTSVD